LTTLLYTGEQFNATTGLYYLRARYYDPGTGRFNRLDPFAGSTSDPVSLHKYLYAGFSLTEILVNTAIMNVLTKILAPVIKPAMRYLVDPLFEAILPVGIEQHLSHITWSDLSAVMVGGNVGYTVKRSVFGAGITGSVEILWSPKTYNWGLYASAESNVSIGGSPGLGASVKAGLVFNAPALGDYTGAFRTLTVGYRWLPKRIKTILKGRLPMLRIPPGTSSLMPTHVPGVGSALLATGKNLLGDIFTRLDNKALTFFWSPYMVGAFGFSVESLFSEDGSSGIATGLANYWLLAGDEGTPML